MPEISKSYMLSQTVMGILLLIFWSLIVEDLTFSGFILGLVSSAFVIYIFREFVLTKRLRFPLTITNLWRVIKYIGLLVREIILANLQVTRILLSREMNIKPAIVRFRGKVSKEATKVVLGNSITLTPGTLTIDIDEDDFIVHGLTRKHAEGPMDWYLVDKLLEMEAEEDDN